MRRRRRIADGTTISVTATDAAGNASAPATIAIDSVAPAAPIIAPTNGTVLEGTAEANSTIAIDTNGDGTPDATVTADGSGNWTYTPTTPLADGTVVSATATEPPATPARQAAPPSMRWRPPPRRRSSPPTARCLARHGGCRTAPSISTPTATAPPTPR